MTEEDTHGLAAWAAEGIERDAPEPARPAHPLERAAQDATPQPEPESPAAEDIAAGHVVEAAEEPAVAGDGISMRPLTHYEVGTDEVGTVETPKDAPKPAKGKIKPLEPWVKDRLDEVRAQERAAERRAAEAEARAQVAIAEAEALRRRAAPAEGDAPKPGDAPISARQPTPTIPADEIERRALQIASERELNARADATYHAGKAAFPDFDDAIAPLQQMGAFTQPAFYDAVFATDAPEAVIHYLGSNPNEGSRVLGFLKAGNAVKAAAEMTKIATRLEAEKSATKAAAAKKVSSAPTPIRTVGGSAVPQAPALDKMSDEQFGVEMDRRARVNGWW